MSLPKRTALAGAALLAAWAVWAAVAPARALPGYLVAWDFWLGLSVGSLGLSLLHQLTGGAWGRDLTPAFMAGRAALPWLGLLLIPVLLGARHLYPWAAHAEHAGHTNAAWLNQPFFALRAAAYFAFWLLASFRLSVWTLAGHPNGWRHSGWALLLWALVVTFGAMDWLMSLEAPWVSTIYGVMTIAAYGLASLAAATLVVCVLVPPSVTPAPLGPKLGTASIGHPEGGDHGHEDPARRLQDLGSLLLAFLMLWAYMHLSQYLIVWSGDLPEEVPWYLRRGRGGWEWVAVFLALFHFAVPFLLLLMQDVKRNARALAGVALLILAVHAVDRYWLIVPAFGKPPGFDAAAVLAWCGVGAVWLAAFGARWREHEAP